MNKGDVSPILKEICEKYDQQGVILFYFDSGSFGYTSYGVPRDPIMTWVSEYFEEIIEIIEEEDKCQP